MKNMQIFKYLRKLLPFIVIFCLIATYAVYYNLNSSNRFVASEVIHYNDSQAELGLTPTGLPLDIGEIKSASVISKVVNHLGISDSYSVDNLISRISIIPVPDEDKVAQKDAMLDEGEECIYVPSTYIVSFSASSSEGPDFARTIVDETLDAYYSEYSQNYVNVASADNTINDLMSKNYDYIEIMEIIDSSVSSTLNDLYRRIERSPYYRASSTGVSFNDLADEFDYLQSVKVSSLFSKIFYHQITKDKNVLISQYKTKIDKNNIDSTKELNIVDDDVEQIEGYIQKMRDSGNTNISPDNILDYLHERESSSSTSGLSGAYDDMIYSWRDHTEAREHKIIDSAYDQYVINAFGGCTGACPYGDCQYSDKTCSEINDPEYESIKAEVEKEINELIADLTKLYDITMETNNEYNEYLGASYISVLSTASVSESVNVKLYTVIAFVFLVVICCGGAIVFGRLADIVNYIFYTDHLTNMSNRAYMDRYLKSMDKKLLDGGSVYCMIDITNLAAINTENTRQTGDEIIKIFTRYIKDVFGKSEAEYIYNGNGSFVILVSNSDYITVEDIMGLFKLRLEDREEYKHVRIEYKVGIASTYDENKTARKLLAEAIKSKKPEVIEATEKKL